MVNQTKYYHKLYQSGRDGGEVEGWEGEMETSDHLQVTLQISQYLDISLCNMLLK